MLFLSLKETTFFKLDLQKCVALTAAILVGVVLVTSCSLIGLSHKPKPLEIPALPLEAAPPPVEGQQGMVVSAHPLAAESGLQALQDGGNAVDAALAALFMLNVVEPHASGLGGGGFGLVRMNSGDCKAVIYREKTAAKIDPAFYYDPTDTSYLRMNHGGSAVCVPGAAAGWAELYDNWATLPLERLMRDAIDAAENGFVVDPTLASQIQGAFAEILADSSLAKTFLKGGLPYEAGDTLRQPELAQTFKTLLQRGLRSFYRGPIAEAVAQASQAGGGFITPEDLEFYRAETVDPIRAQLNGRLAAYEAVVVPPPSRGGAAMIEALNLCSLTGAFDEAPHSAGAVHLMSQCIQQASNDAAYAIGDPKFSKRNWQELSTLEFAMESSGGIALDAKPGVRWPTRAPRLDEHGNTTHLVAVDKWGNAVSLTQTINHFFGAGVMAPGTGIILNNQMGDFSVPPPDTAQNALISMNLIEPGKRPRSNMAPLILLKDGKPTLVIGTPGGTRIISAMVEIVANVEVYGMDISAAIDYPRFFPTGEHQVFENRCTKALMDSLMAIGYVLHPAGPYHNYFGGAHGIAVDTETGKLYGAADKRRGGAARGD